MKVKKIEWEKTVIGLHATLPMQLHARISKQGELYKWAIMRSAMSIVSYFAKSEEQAKADCQKAWEDMVMSAFEKNEGCEYCLEGKKLRESPDAEIDVGDKVATIDFDASEYDYSVESFEITYCPKCGRQLLGNSQ